MGRVKNKQNENEFQSLQAKISRPILFWTILVLCISHICLYTFMCVQNDQKNRQMCRAQLSQIEETMTSQTAAVIEKLYSIRGSEAFEECLREIVFDTQNDPVFLAKVADTLSSRRGTNDWVGAFYLYTPRQSYTEMTFLTNPEYRFEESSLYQTFLDTPSPIVWGNLEPDPIFITRRSVIPVIYKFWVDGCSEPLGLLANLEKSRIYASINRMELPQGGAVILTNADGQRITDNLPQEWKWILEEGNILDSLPDSSQIKRVRRGHKSALIGAQKVAIAPWYVIYVYEEHIWGQILLFSAEFFMVSALAVIAIWLFIHRVIRHIVKPVVNLADAMERAGESRYHTQVTYPGQDELRILTDRFNEMIAYTRDLFETQEHYIEQLKEEKEKVRVEQLLKRRAEFMALQAQINPHFLYNTLDSIRWKAEELDATEISQMVQALATLFRIDLSRGQEMIPVSQELLHVTSYLSIQKYRCRDKVDYRVEAQKEGMGAYVPKIILQPLVENSIYHGIRPNGKPGMIVIRCRVEEQKLILEVEDDGAGIEQEKLLRLKKGLADRLVVNKEGYGIFNVNERIRLYFGEEYGLTIESCPSRYTRVTIKAPLVEEDEVEHYVPYFDHR